MIKRGFTLVEVVVVIVVIGILATIVTYSTIRFQQDSRDGIKASSTTVLSEALEKYYDKNGEYPGCQQLNGSADSVAQFLGVDKAVLAAPGAAAGTNSITCTGTDPKTYRYSGDASATCTTGIACLFWTIEYTKDADKSTVALDSRRRVEASTAGAPTLNGSVASSVSANLTWTAVGGAQSYNIQYSTSSTFTNPLTDSATGTADLIAGLSQGVTYYFRVNAQTGTGASGWSNTRALTTTINAPAKPTIATSQSGLSVLGTLSVASCPAGTTAQYQQRYRSTSTDVDGTWTAYSAWGTNRVYTVTTGVQGTEYSFQGQTRCVTAAAQSGAALSDITIFVVPIATPVSATISAAVSGSTATGTLTAITCPSGATAQYQIRYRISNDSANLGTWSTYDGWNGTMTRSVTISPGYRAEFQGQVRCMTVHDTSDAQTSSAVGVTRPLSATSAPAVSVGLSGATATATVSAITCESGATPQYSIRTRQSSNTASMAGYGGYSAWGTSLTQSDLVSEGYRRDYQAQARCVGDFNITSGAESSEASTVRGISAPAAAPTYTGDTTWDAGYRYRMTYNTPCPAGTWLTEGVQYYHTGFDGSTRKPASSNYTAPDDELFWLGWAAGQVYEDVYYYGTYRCSSSFATSSYGPWSSTRMEISCAPARRNYDSYPRCDSYGQNWAAQPYGG